MEINEKRLFLVEKYFSHLSPAITPAEGGLFRLDALTLDLSIQFTNKARFLAAHRHQIEHFGCTGHANLAKHTLTFDLQLCLFFILPGLASRTR